MLCLAIGSCRTRFLKYQRIDDRDDHSECRDRERRVEPELLTNDLHHDRREKRTDVDAHVKDVVGAVLEVAAFGIEIADHRRDVRLEEAVADDEARQRGVDRPERRNRQQSVAGHEEESADHHGLAIAGDLVGDQPPISGLA